jgi:hypothetical protein
MPGIRTAEIDDFAVAVDGGLFILSTMVSEMTFHEPRFCVVWINLENTVDEYLRNFPSFF